MIDRCQIHEYKGLVKVTGVYMNASPMHADSCYRVKYSSYTWAEEVALGGHQLQGVLRCNYHCIE